MCISHDTDLGPETPETIRRYVENGCYKIEVGAGKGIKELTLTFEAVGDKWKQVGTGTYSDGSPLIHNYVMAWDGKDHPMNGKPPGWTLAVVQVDDYTQNVTVKQDGKVVDSGRVLISQDGKTMTTTHQDPDTVEVFEKQ
jgi:hypothetical protein